MAQLDVNSRFVRWLLTPEEQRAASVFSEHQLMHLQNIQANTVDTLVNMQFDSSDPHNFGVQKAFQDGQLAIIAFLIDTHFAIKKDIADEIRKAHKPSQE